MEELRDRLLETAEELFLARGFDVTSVDDIADTLGMSKRTIYKHFSSKKALAVAVVDRFFHHMDRLIEERMARERSVAGKLRAFLEVLLQATRRINLTAQRRVQHRNPELWQHINGHRRRIVERRLGALIQEGRREGLVRDDIPVQFMVDVLVTLVQSFATPGNVLERSGDVRQFLSRLTALMLDGMRGASRDMSKGYRDVSGAHLEQ